MNEISLYEQLGSLQFQIDKLLDQKAHTVRQIEIQMTIESVKQRTKNGEDDKQ